LTGKILSTKSTIADFAGPSFQEKSEASGMLVISSPCDEDGRAAEDQLPPGRLPVLNPLLQRYASP
jgi:hypothetical protein